MTLKELYEKGKDAPRTSREYTALDRALRDVGSLQYSANLPPMNDFVGTTVKAAEEILQTMLPGEDDIFDMNGMIDNEFRAKAVDRGRALKEQTKAETFDDLMEREDNEPER